MSNDPKENMFLADYMGMTGPNVSKGGYVVKFLVPFSDADRVNKLMGVALPDDPITYTIVRVGRVAKNENGEYADKQEAAE